jgi:hypothetical protein
MERRRDYRHPLRYSLSLKCRETHRVLDMAATCDVSASGLRFEADEPHGLSAGDRLEVRLRADVSELTQLGEVLELATDAVVVRAEQTSAALRFDAPLAY